MAENLRIDVNLDAKCKRCGKGGAVNETGLCLECITDKITKEGFMRITMKVDALAVKGKIDDTGCFHKQLIAKVSIAYDPEAEAFLSGHLMEAMVAEVDMKQFAL